MFRRPILAFMLCGLMAGCATSPERQAQLDGDRCAARGYQPGSKGHDDCLTQVQGTRDSRLQQRHREVVEGSSAPPFRR